MILASSREIYGQCAHLPVTEDQTPQPINTYARSKLAAERAVETAIRDGLNAAILRFSTVYGARDDHADRLIPAFCLAAITRQTLNVEGADNCVDITHVRDVANAIRNLSRHLTQGAVLPVMHLTTGQPTRLDVLARMVIRLARSDSPVRIMRPRDYDVARFAGDSARAAEHIGWRPTVGLEVGIRDLIAQLRAKIRRSAQPA